MYILQARITLDRKDNHLDQSSETSNVFKQSSTYMPPQTGVTLSKYAFFLWGWKPLKGDPLTSFDDQTLPNQLLHQYSLFTTTLSKKIMGQFFLPHSKIPILILGCGPLWRTSHCGRLGQVMLLLSYIFGVIKSLRVQECKNNPFILLGAEKMGQYVSACFSLFAGWFWCRQNLILKHQKVTWSLLDKILCL